MTFRRPNLNGDNIVTILGGSGFVGQHVVKEVAKTGARIRVVSRNSIAAKELSVCGAVGQIVFMNYNLNNINNLEKAIKGSRIVINLLGILYEKGDQNFETIHTKLAHNASKIAATHNVKKFIHFSALGIDKALKSNYAKTKLAGEKAVLQNFPTATVLRPSVIFGIDDHFINLFEKISRFFPLMPIIGDGKTKFQLVYVEDVAKAVLKIADDNSRDLYGKILDIVGPKIYSFKAIIQLILKHANRRRILVNIPFTLAKIQAFFLEFLPRPLLTRDQVTLLEYDNVLNGVDGLKALGIDATSLGTILPLYFSRL